LVYQVFDLRSGFSPDSESGSTDKEFLYVVQ